MKKIILIALAFCSICNTLQAQRFGGEMRNPQGRPGANAFQKLGISEEQKQKAKSIHESFRKEMTELNKNDAMTVKEWKEKKAFLEKQNRSKMQNLLTPDQKKQMEKMKSEKKEIAAIEKNTRQEKMKIHLGLTPEQSTRLKKEQETLLEKMKSIRENNSLSLEQKKAEVKILMEKRKEIMSSVLNIEQQKKLQERKKQHPVSHRKNKQNA